MYTLITHYCHPRQRNKKGDETMKPRRYTLEDREGKIVVEVSRHWIRMWRVEEDGKIRSIIGFEPTIINQIKVRFKDRTPRVTPGETEE